MGKGDRRQKMKTKRINMMVLPLMIFICSIFAPASAQPVLAEVPFIPQTQLVSPGTIHHAYTDSPYATNIGFRNLQLPMMNRDLILDIPSEETTGPYPDEGAARWSGFYYVFIPGSAFTPRTSSTNWVYGGDGCVYTTTSSPDLFTHKLNLPHLSRIDYLRLFYYDISGSNSSAYLTQYDSWGGVDDMLNARSDGNGGYGSNLSPYLGHVYDETTNTYVLNWIPVISGSTMQLCGMRIAYRIMDDFIYLPLVVR
jgi:hypothetical protein